MVCILAVISEEGDMCVGFLRIRLLNKGWDEFFVAG